MSNDEMSTATLAALQGQSPLKLGFPCTATGAKATKCHHAREQSEGFGGSPLLAPRESLRAASNINDVPRAECFIPFLE